MNTDLPKNIDLDNPEFQNVWNLIKHTRRSVFMTGKAGTGKSTFLKYICANTKKRYVVLAPTGIAAVNVGGATLHSFFKIPFKPLLPNDPDFSPRNIRKTLRYSAEKVKLIKKLDLIIIDEISMVRADIIDFVDKVLRTYSGNQREPFGGKQLLFVGDVFQLEPVVTRDVKEILQLHYKQFYFFNAHVFADLGLIPIELRKIYRQNDGAFISMLDRVRVNRATTADLKLLNSRYDPDYSDVNDGKFVITLATRRDTVDSINSDHLNALKAEEYTFHGEIDGNFPDNDLPTSKDLTLKEGAQVIFIRNEKDGLWVNGTIGKVCSLTADKVRVELENGATYELEPELWENIQYKYNPKEDKVEETILGTFRQYPIKPAWALTVHKSQGLTFNHVVIDFAGGAFTSGQTYVALSRCTSLEGITLLRQLSERDIIVSRAVTDFSANFNNARLIDDAFRRQQAMEMFVQADVAFNHGDFRRSIECFIKANSIYDALHSPTTQRLIALKLQRFNALKRKISSLEEVIDSQNNMLRKLAMEYVAMGDQALGFGSLAEEDDVAYGGRKRLDEIAIKSALANYNKALMLCPDCIAALMGKARLLRIIDQPDNALKEYDKVLDIEKQNFDALLAIAETHTERKDVPAAIKAYKRAIRADKKQIAPHLALAEIYDTLGLDELAEEHREIAERLREAAKKKRRKK